MFEKLFQKAYLPPQVTELEDTVLGALMLDQNAYSAISSIITADCFYKPSNMKIFAAIHNIHKKKTTVDILTVVQELKSTRELEDAGGAGYVSQLTNKITSAAHIESHARIILQMYLKRRIIETAQDLVQQGFDETTDVFDVLEFAQKEIKDIESKVESEKLISNEQIITEVIQEIDTAKSKGGIIGASTGMKSLDHAVMGLRKTLKYVIAGRPGQGKTSLAKSICINMAHEQNLPGVFFSMEMPRNQLMLSCISEILKIPNHRLQKGEIIEKERKEIEHLKKTLFARNFIIDDKGGLSPNDIRARIRKLKQSHNIQWFALDYLGLARLKGKEHSNKTRENVISDITADMKNICKEFNLIGIELAQLSREVTKDKDKRPQIHHLKDSGAIEANADVVILVYRPEEYGVKTINGDESSKGFAELIIAKNRFGRLMSIATQFTADLTGFTDHKQGIELEIVEEQNEFEF